MNRTKHTTAIAVRTNDILNKSSSFSLYYFFVNGATIRPGLDALRLLQTDGFVSVNVEIVIPN